MRASIYNNPLFAQGLASIVEGYIGNPDRERALARDELDMQRGRLDLENQQLRNDALRQQMARAGRGGGGSSGPNPETLGALFARMGQPQAASPYSTGAAAAGDFIAPEQPLSFGEATPAAMPQAMPAPAVSPAGGISFGEIVTQAPQPVDQRDQIGNLILEAMSDPATYTTPEGKIYLKSLQDRYDFLEPEQTDPMDALNLRQRQLQVQQLEQELSGGGTPELSTSARTTLRGLLGDTPVYGQAIDLAINGIKSGDFANEDEALAYIFQSLEREPAVTNPPGTMLSRLFGMDDGVPDATEPNPQGAITGIRPLQGIGQPGATQGEIVQVSTEEEVAGLPSGTRFMTPDGKIKVKP